MICDMPKPVRWTSQYRSVQTVTSDQTVREYNDTSYRLGSSTTFAIVTQKTSNCPILTNNWSKICNSRDVLFLLDLIHFFYL